MTDTGKSIGELYKEADEKSIGNAERCRRFTAVSSFVATGIAVSFLLYDEINFYGMIFVCGLLLWALFAIFRMAEKSGCHKAYLENRMLAEGLRVQNYLFMAGMDRSVASLVPWTWKHDLPHILNILEAVYKENCKDISNDRADSLKESWIRDQKEYHIMAIVRTKEKLRRNSRIVKSATFLTILVYACTLFFEIIWGGLFGQMVYMDPVLIDTLRIIFKVTVGSLSAATVFAGAYYGKFSLEDTLAAHERMAALFETKEKETVNGLDEKTIIYLAAEELSENITWFAYQSKNGPEISL